MKGLYRGFCRNENGTETIVLNGERIKGEWVQGFYFDYYYDCCTHSCIGTSPLSANDYSEIYSSCYAEVIPETVCEAMRGLTDRNGKQVFEGDMVTTTPLNKISVGYENKYIGKIIWTDEDVASCGCCYPSFKGVGYVLKAKYERLKLDESCEVIGTIFDEQFAEGEK